LLYFINSYIYQYKDHLGNVRIAFAKDNAGVVQPNANEGQSHGAKMKKGEGVGRMINFNAEGSKKGEKTEHSNI
jgi:hypothetical protein